MRYYILTENFREDKQGIEDSKMRETAKKEKRDKKRLFTQIAVILLIAAVVVTYSITFVGSFIG